MGSWLDQAFDPMSLFGIVILPLWALMAIASLVWCVQSTVKRAWHEVLLATILPVTVVLMAILPGGIYYALAYPADLAHFIIQKPAYDRAVAALPSNGHRFMIFDWGGWLFAWGGGHLR